MMAGAYDTLLNYALNLMKTNLPPNWRSIKTSNVFFQTHVACIKGALEILMIMGYTSNMGSFIRFPPEVALPDPERLSMVAAELLMAKFEVEKMKIEAESERHYPSPGADRLRQDLFASFKGFNSSAVNSSAVTRYQEVYALRFIERHESQAGRYVHIPFCDIMTENKVRLWTGIACRIPCCGFICG